MDLADSTSADSMETNASSDWKVRGKTVGDGIREREALVLLHNVASPYVRPALLILLGTAFLWRWL